MISQRLRLSHVQTKKNIFTDFFGFLKVNLSNIKLSTMFGHRFDFRKRDLSVYQESVTIVLRHFILMVCFFVVVVVFSCFKCTSDHSLIITQLHYFDLCNDPELNPA